MKKRTITNIMGLSVVLFILTIAPTIANGIPIANHAEVVVMQGPDENNSIPASSTVHYIESEGIGREPNTVVEYNVETGIETEYSIDYDEIQSGISSLEPFLNVLDNEPKLTPIPTFGPEDLDRVYDTTVYPFSAIVKIISDYNETHVTVGSGAMISEKHVLTAGHVIYDYYGGWAENVRIVPGKNGYGETVVTEPFGRAYPTHMRSTTGWTHDVMSEHDWAVLTLDRDIGDETGWLGVLSLPDGHSNYSQTIFTAGYPATTKEGAYMYNISGAGGYEDEFNHHYPFYGEGGQSGSSVWTIQNDSLYALSVYAYGPSPGFGTRITQEKFDLLNLWFEQDNLQDSLPDLNVAGGNNILQDLDYEKQVVSLFTGVPIATEVWNYGASPVDKVTLGFYLSEDDEITAEDYQFGKVVLRNIGAYEQVEVEKTLRVPSNIPSGWYELGWIIDPEDEVAESFEDNNVFVHTIRIQVISSFANLSIGLWLGIVVGAAVLAIAIPTVVSILVKRKRKLG